MAVLNSTATTVKQMLQDITTFLTDAANFTAGNEWQLMRPAAITTSTTEVILKSIGDGQDEIYIGMKIKAQGTDQENILLNGFAGYDANLEWYEQPGSIYQDGLPCIPLAKDTFMTYWVTANTSRVTIHVEMSNHYEAAYLGFFKPVAIERQYPYPMLIGGSTYDGVTWNSKGNEHSLYMNPHLSDGGFSAMCVRRPDGVWRYGGGTLLTWPQQTAPVDTFTVYEKNSTEATLEDHMLYPIMLYETEPLYSLVKAWKSGIQYSAGGLVTHNALLYVCEYTHTAGDFVTNRNAGYWKEVEGAQNVDGVIGELDGIYWLGNRADLAVKDNVIYRDKTYKIFNNSFRRDDDQYHCVEWA